MRRFSAYRGLLAAATVIGTALFCLPASAATFAPLPATYDPSTGVVTIGVKITDNGHQFPTVKFWENVVVDGVVGYEHLGQPSGLDANGDAFVTLTNYPLGLHTVTVVIEGGPVAPEGATFTYVVPRVDWLPAVLDRLLSG